MNSTLTGTQHLYFYSYKYTTLLPTPQFFPQTKRKNMLVVKQAVKEKKHMEHEKYEPELETK